MFIYQTDFGSEICDELLNYFNSNKKLHEAGRCGDGIDKNQKDSTDLTIYHNILALLQSLLIKGF